MEIKPSPSWGRDGRHISVRALVHCYYDTEDPGPASPHHQHLLLIVFVYWRGRESILQPSHGGSWAGVSCFLLCYRYWLVLMLEEFWKIKYWFSPRVFLSPVVGGGSVSQSSPSPSVSRLGCDWWRLVTWPRSCLWLVDRAREPRSLGGVSWPGHPRHLVIVTLHRIWRRR